MTLQRQMTRVLAFSAGVAMFGCLPADTRPEPGSVSVTAQLTTELSVSESEAPGLEWTTSDGWAVTLDRLLVSMGRVRFSADSCNEYSEAGYGRILDLIQPDRQKLGLLWGLNDCRLAYSVFHPNGDAVLGTGVTAEDRNLMQNALVPTSSPTGVIQEQGMALYVRGKAEKAGVSVTFDWGFVDRINWTECKRSIGGTLEETFHLASGDALDIGIAIDPRALFVLAPDTARGSTPLDAAPTFTASSLMQWVVDADQLYGDANGRVSLDELFAMRVSTDTAVPNLAELLRQRAYPSMFRYDKDGHCDLDTGRRGGRF